VMIMATTTMKQKVLGVLRLHLNPIHRSGGNPKGSAVHFRLLLR